MRFGIPLVIQLLCVVVLVVLLHATQALEQAEYYRTEFYGRMNYLGSLLSLKALDGVTYALTGDNRALKEQESVSDRARQTIAAIEGKPHSTAGPQNNGERPATPPHQAPLSSATIAKLERVAELCTAIGVETNSLKVVRERDGDAAALDALKRSKLTETLGELWTLRSEIMEGYRQQYFANNHTEIDLSKFLMPALSALAVLNVMAAVYWLNWFGSDVNRRLTVMTDNSYRLASEAPLNPRLDGDDEISHLDRVFHHMAASLAERAQRERAIVDNALDVICSIDDTGRFREVNPAALSAWGYAPAELIGSRYVNLIVSDLREHTSQTVQDIISSQSAGSFETILKHKDGQYVHVEWVVRWSQQDKCLFCVAHDITDRKRMDRMKQDFVSMVSHDLRTPLSSLQGFLELLSAGVYGDINEQGVNRLGVTQKNIDRLISLINSLLFLEKLESGVMDLDPVWVDIDELYELCSESVQDLAKRNKIRLRTEFIDLDLFVDRDMMIQVLVNLLSNAVKFSPAQSEIVTRTRVVEAPGISRHLLIEVVDRGPGIPLEQRESIFERFRQVEPKRSVEKKGTGLGLAISKTIAEQHGGSVGVESEVGKGSTFYIRLPENRFRISPVVDAPDSSDSNAWSDSPASSNSSASLDSSSGTVNGAHIIVTECGAETSTAATNPGSDHVLVDRKRESLMDER